MEKTEAMIIRVADFSETSRVVTLFSRDFGKMAALAKGIQFQQFLVAETGA